MQIFASAEPALAFSFLCCSFHVYVHHSFTFFEPASKRNHSFAAYLIYKFTENRQRHRFKVFVFCAILEHFKSNRRYGVQPEFFALEGLGKLLQTIRLVQGGPNPDLTIEGFVVTMFDGRTKVHNQVLGELREHFKDMVFDTIIQRNIRLSEAPSHGKPIILYDVICNGTTNYLNLAKEVLEKNSL